MLMFQEQVSLTPEQLAFAGLAPTSAVNVSVPSSSSFTSVLPASFFANLQPSLFPSLYPSTVSLSLPTVILNDSPRPAASTVPEEKSTAASSTTTVAPSLPVVNERRVFDEKCVVCEDRATGLHYSVPSCNGCKTFFRRTIICGRQFKCSKNGRCSFNKQGRCSCRACRFQKCLDAGMNPMAIQHNRPSFTAPPASSPPQKTVPPSSFPSLDLGALVNNLGLPRSYSPLSAPSSSTGGSPAPAEDVKPFSGEECSEALNDWLVIECKMNSLRKNAHFNGGALLDLLTKPPAINNKEHLTSVGPSVVFLSEESRQQQSLNYELAVCIEYAKTHAVFRELSFCDKCVIIEDTSLALFVLTSAYDSYSSNCDELKFSNGHAVRFHDENGNPSDLISCIKRCHLDPATFALTKALTFLNPEAYGLSSEGKSAIEAERNKAMKALGAYTFQRFRASGPSILGESLLLSATALALGKKIRAKPPAEAPLLYITTPVPVKKEVASF